MRIARFSAGLAMVFVLSGCVYYNTFFHARKAYNEAEAQQAKAHVEVATGAVAQKYSEAIKKASKVLQNHPKSKYADDALLLIGKAFYRTGEYARAKEKFVELATVFRDSPLLGESRYFLGMSEYFLGYPERARTILEEVVQKGKSGEFRDRARFMIARIPFEEERYEDALPGLRSYLAGGAGTERALRADSMMAVCFWELGQFDSARVAYGRLASHTDDPVLAYEASYRRSECSYRAGNYEQGIAEFRKLAGNDKYFEHRGMLDYQVAEGLRTVDSVDAAVAIFRRVIVEYPSTEAAARSYFALGEVYEERGDSLKSAQEFYREAGKAWSRDPELAANTVQKSTQISQLLALRGSISGEDSTSFAESHFLLGELYLRQLNLPDSALEQFRLVVDDYSESEYAPLAFLNMVEASQATKGDSAYAKSVLRKLVDRYPQGEAAMWARVRLGLAVPDDIAKSDVLLIHAAENVLFEQHNPDSALRLYDRLIQSFPDSRYMAKALFARAWILEHYFPGEDSTVYYAYKDIVDQYGGTSYGRAARDLLNPPVRPGRQIAGQRRDTIRTDTSYTDTSAYKTTIAQTQDTTVLAPEPIQRGAFEYPAIPGFQWRSTDKFEVVFLIHINDRGEVDPDLKLVGGSGHRELDEQAKLAVQQTLFDPVKLDPFLTVTRQWYKFVLIINPPSETGNPFDTYQDPFGTGGQN